jgi:dienelactone hydrolase
VEAFMAGWIARAVDGVASFLGRLVLRRSPPSPNTLAHLGVYRGRTPDELFAAPDALPHVTITTRWRFAGLECRHLSFPSTHDPIVPEFRHRHATDYQLNNRVHVRWLRHRDDRPRATMVLLHSWMQPDTVLEELTLLPWLARRLGVNVARMQLPYHGRRRPECSRFDGELFWTADLVRTFEAIRQSVIDARALTSWLLANEGGPVGAAGMSLGGMMTLALTALDDRLAFAIPVAAHLDLAGVLADASLLRPMRAELARHGWGPEEVDAYIAAVGMKDLEPRIPRERMLFVAGVHDRLLAAHRTHDLWKRWGEPAIHWYDAGHLGIFTHLRGTVRVMREFLDGLGLVPEPSAETRHASDFDPFRLVALPA